MFLLLILRLIFLSFFSMSVRHEATFINGKTKIPPGGTPLRLAPAGQALERALDGAIPRLRCCQAMGRSAAFHVRKALGKKVCFFFKSPNAFRTDILSRSDIQGRYGTAKSPFAYRSSSAWQMGD